MNLLSIFANKRVYTINGVNYEFATNEDNEITLDLLSIPAFSQAIEIKANDIAQCGFRLYLKTPSGRIRQDNTAIDYAISTRPNGQYNAFHFWKTIAYQAIIAESYVLPTPGNWEILPFGRTSRYLANDGSIRVSVYEMIEGKAVVSRDYPYSSVLHYYESQDEYGNPYPIKCRYAALLGLASKMYQYTTNLYNRGGMLVGYMTTSAIANKPTKESIIDMFKNLLARPAPVDADGNKTSDMKVAALDNGWEFKNLNLTPQELMIMEQKKDLTKDVAAVSNMPLWKLGVIEDYHYASGEQAQRDYLASSLNPLFIQIETESTSKLFASPLERDFYIEATRDTLIQLDAKTSAEIDDIRLKNGTMLKNEARARNNQPIIEGGDSQQVQVNTTSTDFQIDSEKLKLEKMKLENLLLAKQLLPPASTPTPPSQPSPDPAPTDTQPDAPQSPSIDELRSLQSLLVQSLTPETISGAIDGTASAVGSLVGIAPEKLSSFVKAYSESVSKRGFKSPAYEANRLINALTYEALKTKYGSSKSVRWIGGEFNNLSKPIGEAFKDNLKHPPLTDNDTESFILLDK